MADIVGCIEKMTAENKLILLTEICLLDANSDHSIICLSFKSNMFIGTGKSPRKKVKAEIPLEKREINT